MNIDLGSPVLDIAIALSFLFFLLSVIVSAVGEFWAGVFKLRAKTLKAGLNGMLGDAVLVEKVLGHPLIRTELLNKSGQPLSGGAERGPSYISARDFAQAFRAEYNATAEVVKQLKAQLAALGINTAQVTEEDQAALERWFDDSMDRVSGWYKRKSQIIALIVAVVVAVGLNANALRVGEYLEREPTVRGTVVAQAEATAKEEGFIGSETSGNSDESGQAAIEAAGRQATDAYKKIDGLKLPLFWSGGNLPHGFSGWAVEVVGLLLTAVAISFGAPFWFDALGKLANLRMAGNKPSEVKTVPS
jgi:hypothetical protein